MYVYIHAYICLIYVFMYIHTCSCMSAIINIYIYIYIYAYTCMCNMYVLHAYIYIYNTYYTNQIRLHYGKFVKELHYFKRISLSYANAIILHL